MNFALAMHSNQPCEALSGIVHSYLQIQTEKPTPYPVMPDGTQAIFISPQGSMIGGAQLEMRDLQLLQAGEYFGIRFYPGALRYFFELNLAEISGIFADGKFFPCGEFNELHTSIFSCNGFTERANICERWLLNHYRPNRRTQLDRALELIYQSHGNTKISQIADTVGWSSRHLNRQFLQHIGLSTKTFSQIIRIQRVCQQLYSAPKDALKTALELGYYDQPHLIKDFKRRLLSTPSDFFGRFMSDSYNS
jgi:AraC-like DNA-binding protein